MRRRLTRAALLCPILVVTALIASVSAASAKPVDTHYTDTEIPDVVAAAGYLGMSVETLEITGVHVVRFVNAISGNQPVDLSGVVDATSGRWRSTVELTGEDLAAVDELAAFYSVSRAQAVKIGTAFLTFLAGIDAARRGLPYPIPTTEQASSNFEDATAPPPDPTDPQGGIPPGAQCAKWPKDVECWPDRDVVGSPDHQFISKHPCVLADAATDGGRTGPVPGRCIVTPEGKVANPAQVSWPLPSPMTYEQWWNRWSPWLAEADGMLRGSVDLTETGVNRFTVAKDCEKGAVGVALVRSAHLDAQAGGAAGSLLDRLDPGTDDAPLTAQGLLWRCRNEIQAGSFTGTVQASPAYVWLNDVTDGWSRQYDFIVETCPEAWLAGVQDSFCGPVPIG